MEIERVGQAGEPVVVLDDFHPHPDYLRAMAARSRFSVQSPHYPGVQARADPRHLAPVDALLKRVLGEVFGIKRGVDVVQCNFSLVTTPDVELSPIQRLPHVDTTDPSRIALLHYLGDDSHGGTAFYRHRATGLDTLDARGFKRFEAALNREGLPKAGYMRGSDDRFEMIHHVPARPNRAVIYRSRLLHSGMIPEHASFSADPATGRLTVNTFLQAGG